MLQDQTRSPDEQQKGGDCVDPTDGVRDEHGAELGGVGLITADTSAAEWALVVETHLPWIQRLVVSRTGRADFVEDVVQEVRLAVTRSEDRPAHPEEVAPWLCTIVIRQCALALRDHGRQQRKLNDFRDGFRDGANQVPESNGDPLFWLLRREQGEIVRSELAALDAQQRQLLIWKYVLGWRHQDIAQRLGVTKDVAEYRVIEARKQLRRRLEVRGIDGGKTDDA